MDSKDAAMMVLMFLVFGVPAVAISVRLVMRSILDAMDRLRQTVAVPAPKAIDDPRIELLEAEVARLSEQMQRLSESEAFHRQLRESASSAKT